MAQIDVSELMTDPDFVDAVTVITRVQSVDSSGVASYSESSLTTIGSVQPASYRTVQKLPESLRMEDLSSFWIKGPAAILTTTASGGYPSILVFRGLRYQVRNVANWGNFGQGYAEGICVAEPPSGAAP